MLASVIGHFIASLGYRDYVTAEASIDSTYAYIYTLIYTG